jgi:hypothetical protein
MSRIEWFSRAYREDDVRSDPSSLLARRCAEPLSGKDDVEDGGSTCKKKRKGKMRNGRKGEGGEQGELKNI